MLQNLLHEKLELQLHLFPKENPFVSQILTGGLLDTQYKLLPLLYCTSHQDSSLVAGLGLDTADRVDSSDSCFDCNCLCTGKCHLNKGHILQVLVLSTGPPVGMANKQGFLMVHRCHFGTELDLHLHQHS